MVTLNVRGLPRSMTEKTLAGLFAQLEPDRPSGLLLSNRRAIRGISACSDVLDLDCDDVTAAELAVDCQIEHGKVASAAFNLEF